MPISAWPITTDYERLLKLRTTIVAFDVYDDVKLGGGGAGPSNDDDDAGRATRRDLKFVARQGALSSRQEQSPTRAVLRRVS
jgi:hypothetical protein